tara:strand:+ start:1021 stop:2775 length:1755 start_codon:yes stop_codon:yes gene_type:complete
MSAFSDALDTLSSRTVGQNSHAQVEWKDGDFQENMVQLYFQLVRIGNGSNQVYTQDCYKLIRQKYSNLIDMAVNKLETQENINLCMSLMFQTRDLQGGKGEYMLFYHLLSCWEPYWNHVNNQLSSALSLLFNTEYASQNYDITFSHPYGSYKDVKYLLNVYRNIFMWDNKFAHWQNYHATRNIVSMAINAFHRDVQLVSKGSPPKTLVAKWLPREKSKLFGWQAKIFAEEWLKNQNPKSRQNALSKYRRSCSMVNKALNTTQIKQCSRDWSSIDFNKEVTSITMQKQRDAFLVEGKNKDALTDQDRIECANNFKQYLTDVAAGKKKIKSARVVGEQLIKQLWNRKISEEDKTYVNAVWEEVIKESSTALSNAIVMLDLSASMTWENCPFYTAIYLALKIACAPGGTKRIMTFSSNPVWINLENCETLTDMIETLLKNQHNVGMSTDIYKAFNMVGNAALSKDLTPEQVGEQMVVILSDMQINQANGSHYKAAVLEENITLDFQQFGLASTHKKPYPRPTLVFWNMKSTSGFPSSVVMPNTILMSGYNSDVLDAVTVGEMNKLSDLKPWDHLKRLLTKARYTWFW